ncbi:radical SAM protein [Mobilitalea sibirica]|uniref:Radical SAM protein n=1 Tax=Mobilitalea sibirica TaxID=1462919 RepID=A0A8J7H4H8_9FIRM|nr:radical SAM protein [Mobilitalea sibirica]MBH1942285.1 radical SAM protein [Mobilitalea sibirica]
MRTIPAKTILSHCKDDSWFGNDYNMNLYKGCCHDCIYCDSRSSCYQIEDFEVVRSKENAISILENELRRKQKTGVIGTGSMSDPYNPYELKYQLTRQALNLIDTYHFGVSIATKSSLITRDVDLLENIASHSPVLCKITITSADDTMATKIEPKVCISSKRFEAVKKLSDHNIYSGILMMPLLPFLTDTEENVRKIIHMAYDNGAKFIYPIFGMSLRTGQREYYYQKLDLLFPDLNLTQLYQQRYKDLYECYSPRVRELKQMFREECNHRGILYHMEDIIAAYKDRYKYDQLSFLF